jgi:hypothetical protein
MSVNNRALKSALKSARRECVEASSLYHSIATSVKDQQLNGTFQQFGDQALGAVATIEGLLTNRGEGSPGMLAITRIRAAFHGKTARLRRWRNVIEDVLDTTERRVRVMDEAASNARIAGDLDAARSLESLRDSAGGQAQWFRDFLR